jgi:hypothetical protein
MNLKPLLTSLLITLLIARTTSAEVYLCISQGAYSAGFGVQSVIGVGYDDNRDLADALSKTQCDYFVYSGVVIGNIGGGGSIVAPCSLNRCDTYADQAPAILENPVDVTVSPGERFQFSCRGLGGNLTYQWFVGNTELPGLNFRAIEVSSASVNYDGLQIKCRVSNSLGSAESSYATIHVTGETLPPTITIQPASQTVREGERITISVSGEGRSLTYEPYINGVRVPNVTGATAIYEQANISMDGMRLSWRVSNPVGAVFSNEAVITVLPQSATSTPTPVITATSTPTRTSTPGGNPTPRPTPEFSVAPTPPATPTPSATGTPTPVATPQETPLSPFATATPFNSPPFGKTDVPPKLMSSVSLRAKARKQFSSRLRFSGSPYLVTLRNLPPGLRFQAALNRISGRPARRGKFIAVVSATNENGVSETPLKITVIK